MGPLSPGRWSVASTGVGMKFNFLHAADLHLDSPLLGLAAKSTELAQRVADASRLAFDNLVALAIERECKFVLLAGDVFDGEWRDWKSGQFFVSRMRRLKEAGIQVYIVLGNHDAENKFMSRLEFSDNVVVFPHKAAKTIDLVELEVAIHGRSFPQRDVSENLAAEYPPLVKGRFNIGILHTACGGRPGHANYAPCSVEQLVNKGYDYWALGHVHAREVLHANPHVVFPGNLQGRHVRETGPKGATLVTVANGSVSAIEACDLDVIRWHAESIDVSEASELRDIPQLIHARITEVRQSAPDRSIAIRLQLTGQTPLHLAIIGREALLGEEIETILATIADDIWVERLEIATAPLATKAALDRTIGGRMNALVAELGSDKLLQDTLETTLTDIAQKFPAAAHKEEALARVRADAMERATQIALAAIERSQGDGDAV
jgi:exonuclease SbcD